jgi:lipopolysaccharide/colanic/teichoic acid biosynthesis glycosyltransferase
LFSEHNEETPKTSSATSVPQTNYDFQWTTLIIALLVLDALTVLASMAVAYHVRISSGVLAYHGPYSDQDIYKVLALFSAPIWLTLFALEGLYKRDALLGGVTEYQRVFKACTAGTMALIVLSFLWRDLAVSRGWLVLSWVLSSGSVIAERFAVRRLCYILRQRGQLTARVLIVGANEQGIAIAQQWSQSPTSGMQVIGFVDDFKPLGTPVVNDLKVIGRPTALPELVRKTGAHEVVLVPNGVAWETFEELVETASAPQSYTFRLSPGFYELLTTGVDVTNKAFVPLLTINEARIVGTDAVLKTVLDYGLGVPLFILTAPFLVLISIGLKLARPHKPVLARYPTLGQGGRIFEMLKFNTRMESVVHTAALNRPMPAWPRTSRLERALYRTGLDKLPQLCNVLAGQMSLVGPRPRVIEEGQANATHNLRTVKPGFIGPWTAGGPCEPGDEIQDELYYVRNWTFWMDWQVMFQTLVYGFWGCWLARRFSPRRLSRTSRVAGSIADGVGTPANVVLSELRHPSSGETYRRL